MNVFGGARAQNNVWRGPRGFPGREGSIKDFCTFLPNTIIKQRRENEEYAYILDNKNPENDLVRNKKKEILQWKNRNKSKLNLKAIHPSSELIDWAGEFHALSFQNSLYKLDTFFMCIMNGYGYTCITFKSDGKDEQALITNYDPNDIFKQYHELSVSHQEIIFRGLMNDKVVQHTVQHNCREWTTLFLDYTNNSKNNVEYTYILNNDPKMQGSFTLQKPIGESNNYYVGGRKDGTRNLSGAIHAIDIYENEGNPKPIPEILKQTIVKNQMYGTVKSDQMYSV